MELEGIIIEVIDEVSGFIKNSEDYYYFDKSDVIENFVIKENIEVIFKPVIINGIKKAILIEPKNV